MLANAFKNRGWEVYEEVDAIATDGPQRRIDIIVINRK